MLSSGAPMIAFGVEGFANTLFPVRQHHKGGEIDRSVPELDVPGLVGLRYHAITIRMAIHTNAACRNGETLVAPENSPAVTSCAPVLDPPKEPSCGYRLRSHLATTSPESPALLYRDIFAVIGCDSCPLAVQQLCLIGVPSHRR